MISKIFIIDTGNSNIKSIANAVNHLNFEYEINNTNKKPSDAKCIILPGVGSFDRVMQSINRKIISFDTFNGLPSIINS